MIRKNINHIKFRSFNSKYLHLFLYVFILKNCQKSKTFRIQFEKNKEYIFQFTNRNGFQLQSTYKVSRYPITSKN